ncbi:uncharacterized protein PV06_08516 [Exophiala oligosperma]|uniref:Uncharacterized protein n=1 Tax=Exophiala oligosperma TaxID=215243 RepID=A0A0D2DWR7_9EURO|nr:uncharacterized protein PV06_08516 [Exophiala oligosperma]KIW39954.1 hypothetical protein PV06_08516 [Exophiala oligosperma]
MARWGRSRRKVGAEEATAAATAEEVRKPTKAEWTGPRVKRTTAEWEAVRKERRRLSEEKEAKGEREGYLTAFMHAE